MTKAQELQALDRFIASLPADTYLRPWLEESRSGIEADIRNDFPIHCSMQAHRAYAQQAMEAILTDASARAKILIEQAKTQAAQIVEHAEMEHRRIDRFRHSILDAVERASRTLREA